MQSNSNLPRAKYRSAFSYLVEAVTNHLASDHPDDCLPWPYSLNRNGYGRVWKDLRHQGAHRIAYEHFIGPLTADKPNALGSIFDPIPFASTEKCFSLDP
jgi:hypothetical protein